MLDRKGAITNLRGMLWLLYCIHKDICVSLWRRVLYQQVIGIAFRYAMDSSDAR